MRRLFLSGLMALAVLALLTTSSVARSKKGNDVNVSEKQAGVVKVEAPRPHVTYLLVRAKLEHMSKKTPTRLVRKIVDATRRAPF